LLSLARHLSLLADRLDCIANRVGIGRQRRQRVVQLKPEWVRGVDEPSVAPLLATLQQIPKRRPLGNKWGTKPHRFQPISMLPKPL
jgi:hypothetical protein